MNVKWKNLNLKKELTMNTIDYLKRNKNVSIKELSDYTGQEYAIILQLMNDLEIQGLIESKTFFNLKKI
jgi:hypothetical protein